MQAAAMVGGCRCANIDSDRVVVEHDDNDDDGWLWRTGDDDVDVDDDTMDAAAAPTVESERPRASNEFEALY